MNITNKFLLYACAAATLLTAGCSDDLRTERDDGGDQPVEENYLRLTLRCPDVKAPLTRSNPTGGENGDGYEPGQDYETRIDDLMLLFYQGTDGVNSPASTPIDKIIYLDRDAMQGDNRTEPVLVGLPGGWYDLLVITNTGNIRPQLKDLTLGEVRDFLQKRAWMEKNGEYSHFVMASDGHLDEKVYICGDNTIDNPASATVEVERHAARIDYLPVHDYFDVMDKTAGAARVSITGAMIVNKLDAGSFMVKRVVGAAADDAFGPASAVEFLGLELPEWGDHQTNYVLDPWSRYKTMANVKSEMFNPNWPERPASDGKPVEALYENYFMSFGTSAGNWRFTNGMGDRVGEWYRVGYTKENTVARADQSPYYCTGVVFRTLYGPRRCLFYDPATGTTDYRKGLDGSPFTFFAFKGVIYGSPEAAMLAFTEGALDVSTYDFTGKTWGDVRSLALSLKEGDPTGYRRFLSKQLKDKDSSTALTAAEAAALAWKKYMYTTFGYASRTDGTPQVNQGDKDTRRLLARYGLHTYVDGVCFYTHWIRHSNNNAPSKGIMEYAIVRNNVYKLRIRDFYGLGDDIPYEPPFDPEPDEPIDPDNPDNPDDPKDPDNPDNPDEPENIEIEVIVKPWGTLPDETIYF